LACAPLFFLGCTSLSSQPTPLKSADAYRFRAQDSGLVAGAEVFDTPKKSSDALGRNVTDEFTPVQVALEGVSRDRFLVERAKARLTCANGTTLEPVSALTMYQVYRESGVGFALVGLPASAASTADSNDQMRAEWTEKEFPAQTILMPGERTGGFLFFRGKCPSPADRSVRLTAHDLTTDQSANLLIELKRPSEPALEARSK
jgi:hypothetical protein